MVERESPREIDKLEALLRELARRNAKLEELAVANLNYLKPKVRRWLKEGIDFPLNEVLTETEEEMVRFYLEFDGKGKMQSLKETAKYLRRPPQSKELIGRTVRYCWIKLKRRELVGPEAVEILKLPGLIYKRLIEEGVVEVGDIPKLSDDLIKGICGGDWGLSQLKQAMEKRGINWNREVEFPLFAAKGKR